MVNSKKKHLTNDQRQELWRMWRMGKSHQAIATQMGLRKPSVFMYIRDRGGIEPRKRTRSEIVLSDVVGDCFE